MYDGSGRTLLKEGCIKGHLCTTNLVREQLISIHQFALINHTICMKTNKIQSFRTKSIRQFFKDFFYTYGDFWTSINIYFSKHLPSGPMLSIS